MIITYKVNMAGPYHNDINLPCQDSFAIKKGNDNFIIAAVADGLGSELYSDIGSAVAVKTAVDYCAEHIRHEMTFGDIKKVMNNALVYAYKAVLTKASEDGNDADEYDTTLCMAVYDGEHLYYAQSGDSGMIALLEDGEYFCVTTQQRDDDGHVFPLCWGPDKWEFGYVDKAVSAVMVMTDGVFEQLCPPLMRHKAVNINVPMARKFMERFECIEDTVEELENAAYKYLEHYPKESLDDDKTVVVLINTDRKPETKDDDYYAIPDWQALRAEAEEKLSTYDKPEENEDETNDSDGDYTGNIIKQKETIAIQKEVIVPIKEPAEMDKEMTKNNKIPHSVEEDGKKKRKCARHSLTFGFNLLMVAALFSFGVLAWVASDFVKQHIPMTAFGIFIACFFSNASVLLPSSSILVVIEYTMFINPIIVILCGAFGASLGELTGYYVGRYGRKIVPGKLCKWLYSKMNKHGYLIVFIFSLIPLPLFDVVGMISGAMKMNTFKFYVACFMGKLIKLTSYVWLASVILTIIR